MVKQEQEKSLTAPLTLPTSSGRKARKASRTGAAGRLNIVRAQIRLPNDIEEDCGSSSSGGVATNSALSAQNYDSQGGCVEVIDSGGKSYDSGAETPPPTSAAAGAVEKSLSGGQAASVVSGGSGTSSRTSKGPKSVASMVRR